MTTNKPCQIRVGIAILLAIFALPLLSIHGDTVTLKNGTKLEGKITTEAADYIKLELAHSGTIKQSKLIKRSDIQSITKISPDAAAMEDLKKILPTPSLAPSSFYEREIKTGPEAFLKAYPNSLLKGQAQKILEELNAEKDKIDRGAIKLAGEWISPEERQNFKTLVKSRIRIFTMKQKASNKDYNGALRDLQYIEEQYIGTPAYPQAVKIALSILPPYGRQLTQQLKDTEFLNQKREADIKLLPLEKQARTEAAFKKEQDTYKALAEQEKKTGVKWRSVNRRNKDSITPMIETIRSELDRLNKIDTTKFEAQAEQLMKVDHLINEDKLKEAKELLIESGGKISGSRRRSSSRSKSTKTKSSYSAELSKKIIFKITAAEELAKNATLSAKAKEVVASIKQSVAKKGEGDTPENGTDPEGKKTDTAEDAQEALMAARKKAASAEQQKVDAAAPTKSSKKPKSTKKKPKERKPSSSAKKGGGINLQVLLIVFAAVMGIVIFIMKKKGIGGGGGDE